MRPVIMLLASIPQAHKGPGACLNLDDPPLSEITDANPVHLSSAIVRGRELITLCARW